MGRQRINDQDVEIVVVAADGITDAAAVLTESEVATVGAVDTTLQANEQFKSDYPDAHLEHIESMRGVDEHRHGRYYLRYRHTAGATEFWGHVAKAATFDFKKGIVGVQMPGPATQAKNPKSRA
jgi:hypothetical protein